MDARLRFFRNSAGSQHNHVRLIVALSIKSVSVCKFLCCCCSKQTSAAAEAAVNWSWYTVLEWKLCIQIYFILFTNEESLNFKPPPNWDNFPGSSASLFCVFYASFNLQADSLLLAFSLHTVLVQSDIELFSFGDCVDCVFVAKIGCGETKSVYKKTTNGKLPKYCRML